MKITIDIPEGTLFLLQKDAKENRRSRKSQAEIYLIEKVQEKHNLKTKIENHGR